MDGQACTVIIPAGLGHHWSVLMKSILAGAFFSIAAVGAASAGCDYQGVTYATGSQICAAGGWLQECTVADYWSAIGYCRAEDGADRSVFTVIDEATHKAAGGQEKPPEK
jgi:hypothetical protein